MTDLFLMCGTPGTPWPFAGMPSLTLTDLARARLQTISFFLVVLLVSALGVRALWNGLRKEFPILPPLSYGKALSVVALWGLLFVLVLTMIAGARELMTPGAWEKRGATYQLAAEKRDKGDLLLEDDPDGIRYRQIDRLRAALWEHVGKHGRLPHSADEPGVAADCWLAPTSPPSRYHYVPPTRDSKSRLLAYEPEGRGRRLALLKDGSIAALSLDEIATGLGAEVRP